MKKDMHIYLYMYIFLEIHKWLPITDTSNLEQWWWPSLHQWIFRRHLFDIITGMKPGKGPLAILGSMVTREIWSPCAYFLLDMEKMVQQSIMM